jgi:hypothetical protein
MNLFRPEHAQDRDPATIARRKLTQSRSMDFQTSLIPNFACRLKTLRAIAPDLRDLPSPAFNELQSLLERAEALIGEYAVQSRLNTTE